VRESDMLLHIVDISHPNFEEQINIVNQTLHELNVTDKPVYLVFNKTDLYNHVPRDEDDLTPAGRENITLDELKMTWMAKNNDPCIFISARERTNLDHFRDLIYDKVREIHEIRYPYNDFLY
jgi:GTPase